ncbi:FAD-dependent oxidoreductase [Rhodococcus daqingensis]|uniref:FAD-dependent oxidoreductase n=1 Tax=Rhodococcus daqingensis TaxID=2479363 RepID=A0ABW2S1P2_9NOCA
MELIGVIGAGTMGAGIAEVCAKAGSSVLVLETKQEFADAATKRIASSISRGFVKGAVTQEEADAALARRQGRRTRELCLIL